MPDETPSQSPRLQLALSLLEDGKLAQGEDLLLRAVRDARNRDGMDSLTAAEALAELAHFYRAADQPALAADAIRLAVAPPAPLPTDASAYNARLRHERWQGDLLMYAGDFAAAETILRANLDARRAFYGEAHPGLAYGQISLADVLLRQERFAEALTLAEEAAVTLVQAHHPHAVLALTLRAWAAKGEKRSGNAFAAGVTRLPDDLLPALVETLDDRDAALPLPLRRALWADLAATLEPRLGPDHDAVLDTLAHLANAEAVMGSEANFDLWHDALRRIIAARERRSEPHEAIKAILGYALASSNAGQNDEANAAYQEAAERAQNLRALSLLSVALRNWGVHLAQSGEPEIAEDRLRAALQVAERTHDADLQEKARQTLGFFLRHYGGAEQEDEAAQLLAAPSETPEP